MSNCYRVMIAANRNTRGWEHKRFATLESARRSAKIMLSKIGDCCVWVDYVHAAGSLLGRDTEDYERVETIG